MNVSTCARHRCARAATCGSAWHASQVAQDFTRCGRALTVGPGAPIGVNAPLHDPIWKLGPIFDVTESCVLLAFEIPNTNLGYHLYEVVICPMLAVKPSCERPPRGVGINGQARGRRLASALAILPVRPALAAPCTIDGARTRLQLAVCSTHCAYAPASCMKWQPEGGAAAHSAAPSARLPRSSPVQFGGAVAHVPQP